MGLETNPKWLKTIYENKLLDSTIAAAVVRQIYRSVLYCFPLTTPCLPRFVIWPPPAHALVCAPQLLFAPEAFVTIAPVTTIIVAAGEAHCAKMTPYDTCLELEVSAIGANSCVICANDVMSDVHNCTELNTTKFGAISLVHEYVLLIAKAIKLTCVMKITTF